ncbi:MAG: hypothetical protein OXE87_01550 [Chloroflexi bacterium]|nr:hypothetical protein [Chloroflexota bacterium]
MSRIYALKYLPIDICVLALFCFFAINIGEAVATAHDPPDLDAVTIDEVLLDPAAFGTLTKYELATSFALGAVAAGFLARCVAIRWKHRRRITKEPRLVRDAIKNGIVSGGLASATLAAVVTIVQTTERDKQLLYTHWSTVVDEAGVTIADHRVADVTQYSLVLIGLVILAAYLAVRDQTLKEPQSDRPSVGPSAE